jgi:hypothetical protein
MHCKCGYEKCANFHFVISYGGTYGISGRIERNWYHSFVIPYDGYTVGKKWYSIYLCFVIPYDGAYAPLRKECTNPLFAFKVKQSLQQAYRISPPRHCELTKSAWQSITRSAKYFKFLDWNYRFLFYCFYFFLIFLYFLLFFVNFSGLPRQSLYAPSSQWRRRMLDVLLGEWIETMILLCNDGGEGLSYSFHSSFLCMYTIFSVIARSVSDAAIHLLHYYATRSAKYFKFLAWNCIFLF